MTAEIVLKPGATAEPGTCGSCAFFERKDYVENRGAYGFCRIVLPAKIALQSDLRRIDPKMKDQEYTGNEDQIRDNDCCAFQRPDGKTYIVQRRVGP